MDIGISGIALSVATIAIRYISWRKTFRVYDQAFEVRKLMLERTIKSHFELGIHCRQ